jgi:hypothetical protein
MENIVEYYKKVDGRTKKKILGCIFSEKLVLEERKSCNLRVYKTGTSTSQCQHGKQKFGRKKEVAYDLLSCVAPLIPIAIGRSCNLSFNSFQ